MRHQDATTWILCARKARGNSSHKLYRELRARGVNVYRVTAGTNPRYSPERVRTIINWGVSRTPVWLDRAPSDVRWINRPEIIGKSANKLAMFNEISDLCVPYTEAPSVATAWIAGGHTVVARTIVSGSRGAGIVLSPPDALPSASLYTKLVTPPENGNVREYRAYIVGQKCVDLTEKRRWGSARLTEAGIDVTDPYTTLIRCNKNGWVFARNTMQADEYQRANISELAASTAERMGLDLGGVDIICTYNEYSELTSMFVVETNTAVSLVGDRNTVKVLADNLAREVA